MKTIDCRGMSCPQPVVETKKALERGGAEEILVLLSDPISKENVRRFAESQGCKVTLSEEKGVFNLKIQRGESVPEAEQAEEKRKATPGDYVIFIDSDSLGRGSEELGKVLIRSFMHTVGEAQAKPQKLILINSGVKLACEKSEVLDDLRQISQQGVEILSCGTCLDYFHLKEKLQVGRISNMYEILTSLVQAGRVLKI